MNGIFIIVFCNVIVLFHDIKKNDKQEKKVKNVPTPGLEPGSTV